MNHSIRTTTKSGVGAAVDVVVQRRQSKSLLPTTLSLSSSCSTIAARLWLFGLLSIFINEPTVVGGLNRGCISRCEEMLLGRLSASLPNHIWVMQQLSAGHLILNRTIVDSVCGVYLGVRMCNWDCAETNVDFKEIYVRNAILEKLCVRKVNEVTKQLPCMERMQMDPICCHKCSAYFGTCGDQVTMLYDAKKQMKSIRDFEDYYPLSRLLTRLCNLVDCQLDCKIHTLLRYCTPEAVFLLQEFAGTPFVEMDQEMRQRGAYTYFPDGCRALAHDQASTLSIPTTKLSVLLCLLLIFSATPSFLLSI